MRQHLPKEIDPFRFAHTKREISGRVSLVELTRLTESLLSTDGEVEFRMQFDIDDTGTPFMQGRFKTTLSLTCERCLQELVLPMEIDSLLGLIRHEKLAEKLSEQYEPWVVNDAELTDPVTVIEDELILALPLVPKHDYDCLPDEAWFAGDKEEKSEEAAKPASPFSVLTSLKTKK